MGQHSALLQCCFFAWSRHQCNTMSRDVMSDGLCFLAGIFLYCCSGSNNGVIFRCAFPVYSPAVVKYFVRYLLHRVSLWI